MDALTRPSSNRTAEPRLGAVGRHFGAFAQLAPEDADLLAVALSHSTEFRAGLELFAQGQPVTPHFVMAGWVCLSRNLRDGRRQIIDLYLPGDVVGYGSATSGIAGAYHSLTDVRCADASMLKELAADGHLPRRLASCLRHVEEEQRERLVDHILRLGRMFAHERFAQFVLHLHDRLDRVGLVTGDSFAMPMTQEMLGDALGMSAVHINRTLHVMRREKMLRTTPGRWQILDRERMKTFASGEQGRLGEVH